MYDYTFAGNINPVGNTFYSADSISLRISMPNEKYTSANGELNVAFFGESFCANLSTDVEISDLYTLRNTIEYTCNNIIYYSNLKSGNITYCNIRSVYCKKLKINSSFRTDLWALTGARDQPIQGLEISLPQISTSLNTPSLTQAIRNFNYAMRFGPDTAFFCRRAFEALSHHFNPNQSENKRKKAIENLGSQLNIDDSVGFFLGKKAARIRHGHTEDVSEIDRIKILKMTRDCILRFTDFINKNYVDKNTIHSDNY